MNPQTPFLYGLPKFHKENKYLYDQSFLTLILRLINYTNSPKTSFQMQDRFRE